MKFNVPIYRIQLIDNRKLNKYDFWSNSSEYAPSSIHGHYKLKATILENDTFEFNYNKWQQDARFAHC